jgi:hypothetical protein
VQEWRCVIGQRLLCRREGCQGLDVTTRALQRDAEMKLRVRIVRFERERAAEKFCRAGTVACLQTLQT